jgi:hypothetical protein
MKEKTKAKKYIKKRKRTKKIKNKKKRKKKIKIGQEMKVNHLHQRVKDQDLAQMITVVRIKNLLSNQDFIKNIYKIDLEGF